MSVSPINNPFRFSMPYRKTEKAALYRESVIKKISVLAAMIYMYISDKNSYAFSVPLVLLVLPKRLTGFKQVFIILMVNGFGQLSSSLKGYTNNLLLHAAQRLLIRIGGIFSAYIFVYTLLKVCEGCIWKRIHL